MSHRDQSPKFTASHSSPPPDLSSYLSPCLAGGRACLLPWEGLSDYEHQPAFPISVSAWLLGQVPSFPLWLAEGSILRCQTFLPSSGAPDSQLRRPPTCPAFGHPRRSKPSPSCLPVTIWPCLVRSGGGLVEGGRGRARDLLQLRPGGEHTWPLSTLWSNLRHVPFISPCQRAFHLQTEDKNA